MWVSHHCGWEPELGLEPELGQAAVDYWGRQAGLKVEELVLDIKEFILDFVGCSSQSRLMIRTTGATVNIPKIPKHLPRGFQSVTPGVEFEYLT